MRWDAEKYGVSFSEEHTVSKVEKVKNGFTLICTDGTQLFTKQCILTCGGAASPRHSCGEGYTLAKQLGHTVTKLYPSLTQLTVRAKQWKTLSGTRAPANAVLLADNKPVYEESGEGIAYLYGGGLKEIEHTIVNSIAIDSGMVCDGAKASCAAKIASAVDAGILGYHMYKNGQQFRAGDGLVTKGVEETIRNIGILAREGMRETDREILHIMCD